ncbi:MAG: OmpA family protein [Acidobacteriota bacterium]|nr:OmpA family protein [Acidobacteriota bacterium]
MTRSKATKFSAALLAMALVLFVTGCKKPVKAPPPAPVARNDGAPPASGARPVIAAFTAEPTTIEKGQSSTLRWSITNATDMTIDQGLGAIQSRGQRQVFPANTTTYTLTASGPGGTDTRSVTVEVSTAPGPPTRPDGRASESGASMLQGQGQDAYFDYDSHDIRPDARTALTTDAELLRRIFAQEPNFSVIVEGHCDERGSAEYNLALGDRRAAAAKDFLMQLGVSGDKLKTISYGKERPQCTDPSEACYQKNRRAHLAPGQ